MSAHVSSYKNLVYHREYKNDWSSEVASGLQRVAMVALPFLSLNKSLRYPLSLGLGSLRVWNMTSSTPCVNSVKMAHTMLAVTAVGAAIFFYPVGMALTTAQDALIESGKLKSAIEKSDWDSACKSSIRLLNHVFHLALICRGGLELSILSLTIHIVVHLVTSLEEFNKGKWLEGCADLAMGAIRMNQLHTQYRRLVRNREIEEVIKRIQVGELHEKWQFPSDHLPVGVEVNGVRVISWNVLNNAYMEWVTDKDSQGLKGSLISDLDQPVNGDGLTQRDLFVADLVNSMTESGQIIALQECSDPFLGALEEKLPQNWQVVRSFGEPVTNQEVVLYDTSALTHDTALSGVTCEAYPSAPGRSLQYTQFSSPEGIKLQLFNAHIPGDPDLPARGEFAQYVFEQRQSDAVVVALGDNNFERAEMLQAYQEAGFDEFSLHSPWKTNIDPYDKESKAIDHIFISGNHVSSDMRANEVMEGGNLSETIDLLKGSTQQSTG